MKHAGPAALDRIEPLLGRLRALPVLKEKSRGTFYCGSRAFLHFHEHGEEMFADVRLDAEFERIPATSAKHHAALMKMVKAALTAAKR